MKTEIKVPSMGESITEASVGVIIKASGSQVFVDEEILEIETDKVNQPLYAPQAGIVTLIVKNGDVVKIGQSIGWVEGGAEVTEKKALPEDKPAQPKEEKKEPAPVKVPTQETPKPSISSSSSSGARIPKEAVVSDFKENQPAEALQPEPQKPVPKRERETRRPLSKIRKVIAQRLVESQQTMAMLTTFNEIDMSHVIGLREKYKESFAKQWNVKLGFMSFFIKAVVAALQAYPEFNSYIDREDIVHREYYDIGIAVGSERGLVVPVVRNCDQLSFAKIEQAIEGYAKQVKEGRLAIENLQGGGFTITNGGVYGSLLSTPIINPPQCGILGLHKIEKRAVVVDEKIVICPMMYVALSYDHRLLDGREAVLFLTHIKNLIEDPARLLLEI